MTAVAVGLGLQGQGLAGDFVHALDPQCMVHLLDQPRTVFEEPSVGPLLTGRPHLLPAAATAQAGPPATPHYRLSVTNLQDGQTVWNDARELPLQLDLQPPLAPGHRVNVYLDGERKGGPFESTRILLHDINRGTHRLQVRVVDVEGRTLAETPPLTLYHHQHSVATPP